MGKFRLKIENEAKKEIKAHYKSGNKASVKTIEKILMELTTHPYTGTGKPEALKYNMTDYWSRRINQKDRMVYKVDEKVVTVFIIAAMGHYNEK